MITPNSPVTIPAVEQKTADGLWLTNIVITAPSPVAPVNALVTMVPFNSSTGEMLRIKQKQMPLTDIFTLAATYPKIGIAVQALFDAIQEQVNVNNLYGS